MKIKWAVEIWQRNTVTLCFMQHHFMVDCDIKRAERNIIFLSFLEMNTSAMHGNVIFHIQSNWGYILSWKIVKLNAYTRNTSFTGGEYIGQTNVTRRCKGHDLSLYIRHFGLPLPLLPCIRGQNGWQTLTMLPSKILLTTYVPETRVRLSISTNLMNNMTMEWLCA